jgi:hypothetical protein
MGECQQLKILAWTRSSLFSKCGNYSSTLQKCSRFAPAIDLATVIETAVQETYDRNSSLAIRKSSAALDRRKPLKTTIHSPP